MNTAQRLYDSVKQVHKEAVRETLIKDIDLQFMKELRAFKKEIRSEIQDFKKEVNGRFNRIEDDLSEIKIAILKIENRLNGR